MKYTDRDHAGMELAKRLDGYAHHAVVYALPRGGVEVAAVVARALDAPLDLIITRKIGHDYDPEYAVGAVTESGPVVWNPLERTFLNDNWCRQAVARERAEAKRRRVAYLDGHKHISPSHKTAIIVDDGIATGLTMMAAVQEIKRLHPLRIVVAVPCAPADAVNELLEVADEVIVLQDPDEFRGAVSLYYDRFPQLTDEEVISLLNGSH